MKPLSSFNYIKSNVKKVLPSFISTILSVFLIFIFGLLLYGSVETFDKVGTNIFKKGTIIYSNSDENPLSDKMREYIYNDDNVKDIIPMIGTNNSFNHNAAFGNVGINSNIFYSEDVETVLKNFDIKLLEGAIPGNNKDEILLPEEMVKQYNLKVGDYIDNKTNKSIRVAKTYKLVGITKGNVWIPIVCDVGNLKREEALKYGIMFFFKDTNNMKINDKIIDLKENNVVIQEYKTIKDEIDQMIKGINLLYIFLDIVIILVLIISLSNLNYIVFLNRKNEFAILETIGISKSKLKKKLFKENFLVCLIGFVVGILINMFITFILNVTIWEPKGQHLAIFRLTSFLVALIVPVTVSIFSMISSIKELKKLNMNSLNN